MHKERFAGAGVASTNWSITVNLQLYKVFYDIVNYVSKTFARSKRVLQNRKKWQMPPSLTDKMLDAQRSLSSCCSHIVTIRYR